MSLPARESEVQVLLADKRTAFALLRTRVSVALVAPSLWTVLVATSRLWSPGGVLWLLLPVMRIAAALLGLGGWLILHASRHLAHAERSPRGQSTLIETLLFKHERWPF